MKKTKLKHQFINGWFTTCPKCLEKNIVQLSYYKPVQDFYECPLCGTVDGKLFDIQHKINQKVVF